MTSTTATAQTFTNTDSSAAQDMAERIVDALKNGWTVRVNGVDVYAPWGAHNAANTWQNGSLSVTVRTAARTPGRTRDMWVKAGASASVEFVR